MSAMLLFVNSSHTCAPDCIGCDDDRDANRSGETAEICASWAGCGCGDTGGDAPDADDEGAATDEECSDGAVWTGGDRGRGGTDELDIDGGWAGWAGGDRGGAGTDEVDGVGVGKADEDEPKNSGGCVYLIASLFTYTGLTWMHAFWKSIGFAFVAWKNTDACKWSSKCKNAQLENEYHYNSTDIG